MSQTIQRVQPVRRFRDEVKNLEKFLEAGYRVVGRHSAVKVCHWTKSALRGGKMCYKSWYGIESHRCIQMTPSVQYCNMMCVFCWRFHTPNRVEPYAGEWDSPSEILDGVIEAQRQLLSGFGGNQKVARERFIESMSPRHLAISLDGEPTLYPHLADFIREASRRGMTTFLVTNGTMPKRLRELAGSAEPTTIYLSLYGPDLETHLRTNKPLLADSWEKVMDSLRVIHGMRCRKIIRLTLVKGYNMHSPAKYAELIGLAQPDYVECKGYTHVGESQKRLKRENMPSMDELRNFAQSLAGILKFSIVAEDDVSRVVLAANPESSYFREMRDELSSVGGPQLPNTQ
ncbi:MAG: 4-demethylwyosine synthase TYW1 [Nitrososphaerota archaeon]